MKWPLVWRVDLDRYKMWYESSQDALREAMRECGMVNRSNVALRGVVTKLRAERDEIKAELENLKQEQCQ